MASFRKLAAPPQWLPATLLDCASQMMGLAPGLLRRRTTSRQKVPEQLQRINAQGLGDRDKFHDVDPPFAAFVFGDERLRTAELLGQCMLADARLLSHCDKKFDQAGMLRGS